MKVVRALMVSLAGAAIGMMGAIAVAQSLTADDVDRALAALEALKPLVADAEVDFAPPALSAQSQGMTGPMGDPGPVFSTREDGSLSMFSEAMRALPSQVPASEISTIVRRHGFASIDHFARTMDHIFTAYIASEVSTADIPSAEERQAALAFAPPQMRAEMEAQLAQLDRLKALIDAAPAENIAVVEAKKAAIDAAF